MITLPKPAQSVEESGDDSCSVRSPSPHSSATEIKGHSDLQAMCYKGGKNLGHVCQHVYISFQYEVDNSRPFPVFSEEISRSDHLHLHETAEHRVRKAFPQSSQWGQWGPAG